MAHVKDEEPSVFAMSNDPYMVGLVRESRTALGAGQPGR